jgi:hypothetical protein
VSKMATLRVSSPTTAGRPISVLAGDAAAPAESQADHHPRLSQRLRDWAGDETDFSRELAEAALAHAVGDSVERAYRRSDALERRRRLMNAWGDYIDGTSDKKVVPLVGRR